MIVFTAIYGGYDQIKGHPDHPAVTDWIAYTDNPDLRHSAWDIRYRPLRYDHPRLAAKWWKCHPPVADTSLWLDGSVQLENPAYIDMLIDSLESADMVMFRHPTRDCLYDEVYASEPMTKYFGTDLRGQVARYQSQGWPAHAGLWASTTFARRHTQQVLAFGGRESWSW